MVDANAIPGLTSTPDRVKVLNQCSTGVILCEMSTHEWHMAKLEKVAPSSLGKWQFPVRQSAVIAAELLGGGDRRPIYMAACKDPDNGGSVEGSVNVIPASKFCKMGISAAAPVMFCKQGADWIICCENGSTARAAIVMMAPRFASQLRFV